MARAKRKAAAPSAPAPEGETTPQTAIKVLKGGCSWHGGEHRWSLPVQQPDGSWTPGQWTPRVTPIRCEQGWHLTRQPISWWGDGLDVVAYLAEYDGRVDGPKGGETDDATKFAIERCRLLRPLTHAELATHGIYLTGEHDEVSGRAILGGDAHIKCVTGAARIDRMYGSARIDRMDGSARIDRMYGSARIDRMEGSATAHASDEAILVLRRGTPTVSVRGRASVLDYRPARPVHHLADEGQVLTLAADGAVTQAATGGA